MPRAGVRTTRAELTDRMPIAWCRWPWSLWRSRTGARRRSRGPGTVGGVAVPGHRSGSRSA